MNQETKYKILNIHSLTTLVIVLIYFAFHLPDLFLIILLSLSLISGLILSFKYKIPIYGKKIITKENVEKDYDSLSITTNIIIIILLVYSVFKFIIK